MNQAYEENPIGRVLWGMKLIGDEICKMHMRKYLYLFKNCPILKRRTDESLILGHNFAHMGAITYFGLNISKEDEMKQIGVGLVLGIMLATEVIFLWSFNTRLTNVEKNLFNIVQFLNKPQEAK